MYMSLGTEVVLVAELSPWTIVMTGVAGITGLALRRAYLNGGAPPPRPARYRYLKTTYVPTAPTVPSSMSGGTSDDIIMGKITTQISANTRIW